MSPFKVVTPFAMFLGLLPRITGLSLPVDVDDAGGLGVTCGPGDHRALKRWGCCVESSLECLPSGGSAFFRVEGGHSFLVSTQALGIGAFYRVTLGSGAECGRVERLLLPFTAQVRCCGQHSASSCQLSS